MKILVDIPDEEYESYALAITFGMGSKAIRRILNGTPLPKGHGRLIDADALKKFFDADEEGKKISYNIFVVNDKIDSVPTIEERKTGKWKTSSDFPDRLICSECSAQFDMWHWEAEQMHYCPKCGAKMKGAE